MLRDFLTERDLRMATYANRLVRFKVGQRVRVVGGQSYGTVTALVEQVSLNFAGKIL
jgi:hypothetical protein